VPPFPERGMKVQAWKNCVYQSLNAASGRPDDDVLIWSRQVEDESVTDETLQNVPRRYASLSRSLLPHCKTRLPENWAEISHQLWQDGSKKVSRRQVYCCSALW
jgi:hypothetical protein